jgi:transposase
LIDKKWLIRLLYKPLEYVKGISPAQLDAIFDNYQMAKNILELVYEFKALLKEKNDNALLPWMDKASALAIPEIDAFVGGLKHDIVAVMNAITTDFSNGLVEGTVNKFKVIKRIMYGRCQFDTLRNKCLMLEYAS